MKSAEDFKGNRTTLIMQHNNLDLDNSVKVALQKTKAVRSDVEMARRVLSTSYNIAEIDKIEADIVSKTAQLSKLREQNEAIKAWISQNKKDKDSINEHGFYDNQVYMLKEAYRNDKQKIHEVL